MKNFVFLLVIVCLNSLYSQTLYVLEGAFRVKGYNQNSQTILDKVFTNGFSDIAVMSSGDFYLTSGYNFYHYNINNDNLNFVFSVPQTIGYSSSLTSDHNGNLYFLANNTQSLLCKYDITNSTFEVITNLGFSTPGDIVFYRGNIIFPASGTNFIKAYNLSNNTLTNIFCLPDFFVGECYGIANHFNSCQESVVILSNGSLLYELDFENSTLLTSNIITNNEVYGLATNTEHLASNCNEILDDHTCTLSIDDYNFLYTKATFYPNPTKKFIQFNDSFLFDSINIIDINGKIVNSIKQYSNIINVSDLKKGIYFLKIFKGNKIRVEKFIKN